MREILFRGKRLDNGEWVYGSFCMDALEQFNGPCSMNGFIRLYDKAAEKMQTYEVDRETVGQCTGLQDKNGKRIFEGDIVADGDDIYVCFWDGCNVEFGVKNKDLSFGIAYLPITEYEVIGNIHDNETLAEDICNWAGEDTQEQEDK